MKLLSKKIYSKKKRIKKVRKTSKKMRGGSYYSQSSNINDIIRLVNDNTSLALKIQRNSSNIKRIVNNIRNRRRSVSRRGNSRNNYY